MQLYRIVATYDPDCPTFKGPGRGSWRVKQCYPVNFPPNCMNPTLMAPSADGDVLFCVSIYPIGKGSFCNPHRMLKEVIASRHADALIRRVA